MSRMPSRAEGPGDADLIAAVRGGDVDAYGRLFARHVDAARRLARQLARPGDVDDLVSDAFARVLGVLQRGGGPDLAFRAYLLTTLRRLHVDRCRAAAHLHTTDDLTPYDAGVAFRDTALEGFESATAARAFASLPERWQLVLWHTEVEGQRPAEVAPLLGLSPNSAAALAYRAREGLRQAFVSQHARPGEDRPACAWTRAHLGPHLRHGLARRDTRRVEDHLLSCRACAAVHLELSEENARLADVLGPLVLGSAAAAYAGSAAAGGASGGGALVLLARLLGRARDLVVAHAPASVAVGVTAGAVVTGGTLIGVRGHDPSSGAQAAGPGSAATTSAPHAGLDAGPRERRPATVPGGPVGQGGPARPARPTSSSVPAPAPGASAGAGRPAGPRRVLPGLPTDPRTSLPTGRPTGAATAPDPASVRPGPAAPAPTSAAAAGPGGSGPPPSAGLPTPATGHPTGNPSGHPGGHPTTPAATPPGPGPVRRVDLAVSGAASPAGAGAVRVVVRVSGLPAGDRATLRVSGTAPWARVSLDPRCAPSPGGVAVCALTGTGTDVDVSLVLRGVPGRHAALRLGLRPAPGTVDRNALDNHAQVPLTR